MLKEYYIPYIMFMIINLALLDILKFSNFTAKQTKTNTLMLAIISITIGGYFLSLRNVIQSEYNIDFYAIIYIATLLITIGIKSGFAFNKK